jgi:hypothetical protein
MCQFMFWSSPKVHINIKHNIHRVREKKVYGIIIKWVGKKQQRGKWHKTETEWKNHKVDDESEKKKTCHVFLCGCMSKLYDSSTNTMTNFTTILRGMKVCSSCASVVSIGVVNMHRKNTLFYRFLHVPSLHSGLFFTSPSFFSSLKIK